VAVGTGAQATGTNTTALGDNAVASGNFAVAVGNNAVASHNNAVALGNGSTTSAANTVSVGSVGSERRVTNVANGTSGTDAVNLNQLNAALGSGASTTLAQSQAYTDQQVGALRRLAFSGIAQAAAIVPLAPPADGETTVNLGLASYGGYMAGGVAIARQIGSRINLNGGVGFSSGGQTLLRVGMGFRF